MSDTEIHNPDTKMLGGAGRKSTVWDDALEVIKELPWGIGPSLVFIARRLGVRRSLVFTVFIVMLLTGVAVGWAIVYFGLAPNLIVSDKYKRDPKKADDSERRTPSSIEVTPLGDPKPDWIQPYVIWLEDEGQAQKDLDTALHVGVGAVIHELQVPTTDFVWSLKANPGFDVDGRAFWVTNDGFIKPLKTVKNGHSVDFDVPKCEKKEKLYAVVIARWKGDMSLVEIQSTFASIIKQGR